jgi:hypothetical protein
MVPTPFVEPAEPEVPAKVETEAVAMLGRVGRRIERSCHLAHLTLLIRTMNLAHNADILGSQGAPKNGTLLKE